MPQVTTDIDQVYLELEDTLTLFCDVGDSSNLQQLEVHTHDGKIVIVSESVSLMTPEEYHRYVSRPTSK
jgi:hypothetical protein